MRIHTDLPEWMTHGYLEGSEDPPSTGGGAVIPGTPPAGDPPPETEDEDDDKIPDNLDGIKSALSKTRDEKKTLNRQYREAETARKAAETALQAIADKDKSEVDRAKDDAAKAATKLVKLADGFKTNAFKSAVERAARDAKFVDVDDAVSNLKIADFEVEQDDDDPSVVKIDAKAVKKAVDDLAKKKPYLLGKGDDGSGDPSGSRFNGGNGNDPKKLSEEQLRDKYTALRN